MWLQLRNNNYIHMHTTIHTVIYNKYIGEIAKYRWHILCTAINRYKPDQIGRVKYVFIVVFLAPRLAAENKEPLY